MQDDGVSNWIASSSEVPLCHRIIFYKQLPPFSPFFSQIVTIAWPKLFHGVV